MSKREVKPINIEKLKMKAEYVLLESVRDELRMIRQLMDKSGVFVHMPAIAENEVPTAKPVEREVAESETNLEPTPGSSPADMINWDPAKLEWETVESRSDKGPYERHPFTAQKVEHTPDYDNLREAILAVQKTGKHVLGHKESGYYYWLSEDKGVIMRRVSKW